MVRSLQLSALLLVPLALAGCSPKPSTDPILIGHLLTPDKAVAERTRQAVLLAVEETNQEEHRIAGRRVVVHHADPGEAVRLITITRVSALIGGDNPTEADSLARTTQSYGIPLVAPAALTSSPVSDNAFAVGLAPALQGRTLARFVAQELKLARVVLLTDSRNPVAGIRSTAFVREFTSDTARRLEQWSYDSDAQLGDLVDRLKELKDQPQAVVVAGSARDLLRVAGLLRKAEKQVPLVFAGDEREMPALLADREASSGVHLATSFMPEELSPTGQAFVKKYQERFHEAPDVNAVLAYDSARVLFEAMRRAKEVKEDAVRQELAGLQNFESVTGPLSIGKDHNARRAVYVAKLEDGKGQMVKRYPPEAE